ncbi:Hypothetical predicted protein [Podarcis lilfordi]|uniref:Uncharacterized protein n=1 Tax=Podarcis lilfordi TaxID=74358 RepID=A0AA35KWT1_9SAUR|nr:Hypothetical predicted protein [Podarcis lilfordi]
MKSFLKCLLKSQTNAVFTHLPFQWIYLNIQTIPWGPSNRATPQLLQIKSTWGMMSLERSSQRFESRRLLLPLLVCDTRREGGFSGRGGSGNSPPPPPLFPPGASSRASS